MIGNFRPITVLNTELKILAKFFFKKLALVVGSIVRGGQICTVSSRAIHNNLYLVLYFVEWARNRSGFG